MLDRAHRHQPAAGRPSRPGPERLNRRRLLGVLTAAPAALGVVIAGRDAAVAQPDAGVEQTRKGYSPDREERKFLDLINDYRRKHGAKPLSLQDQLGKAAKYHSGDMARENYFSHKLSNGDSPEENIERFGYKNATATGENIAAGYETAKQVMRAWKKSRDHARNMRSNRFEEIGIGRAYDKRSKYGWYWTTTFGSRG